MSDKVAIKTDLEIEQGKSNSSLVAFLEKPAAKVFALLFGDVLGFIFFLKNGEGWALFFLGVIAVCSLGVIYYAVVILLHHRERNFDYIFIFPDSVEAVQNVEQKDIVGKTAPQDNQDNNKGKLRLNNITAEGNLGHGVYIKSNFELDLEGLNAERNGGDALHVITSDRTEKDLFQTPPSNQKPKTIEQPTPATSFYPQPYLDPKILSIIYREGRPFIETDDKFRKLSVQITNDADETMGVIKVQIINVQEIIGYGSKSINLIESRPQNPIKFYLPPKQKRILEVARQSITDKQDVTFSLFYDQIKSDFMLAVKFRLMISATPVTSSPFGIFKLFVLYIDGHDLLQLTEINETGQEILKTINQSTGNPLTNSNLQEGETNINIQGNQNSPINFNDK